MEESEEKEELKKKKIKQKVEDEDIGLTDERFMKRFLVVLLTVVLQFYVLDIFYKLVTFHYCGAYVYTVPLTLIFSTMLFTFMLAITKKTSRATYICCGIIFVIGIINQLKVSFTGDPIYFSDINFLKKVPSLLALVSGNVSKTYVLQFLGVSAIFAAILTAISIINKKSNLNLKNKKARIIIIVVDIILVLFFMFPTKTTKDIILKMFFNTDNYKDYASYTRNSEYYYTNGFVNGLYGQYLNGLFFEPDGYDEDELNEILSTVTSETESDLGTPNIIIVFSEAFWNIDKLDEVEFNQEVLSNYSSLSETGKVINLISPSFGGMSENAVFEVVTGCSMQNFSLGYIPVMALYNNKSNDNVTSLINLYKDNGYNSKILFGRDYYVCEDAYRTMGFDDYEEVNTSSDVKIIDTAISDIGELTKQGNYLYVIETFEAHMPYSSDKFDEYEIEITNSNLSDEAEVALRSYAQAIYNSDIQLGRLYEYIQTLEEPTMIIYMGDHLPHIQTEDGDEVFDELEYFNTDDELLNYYRLYNTEALIVSNYDADLSDYPDYLGTDTLLTYLAEHMDIETNSYYDWLYSTIDTLPASNRYVSLDKDGNTYSTNELTGEMEEVLNLRLLMQYKFFIK